MPSYQNISVIGAGAWGTALANAAARAGRNVTLYARDPIAAETISRTRENPRLPNIRLTASVMVTSDLKQAAAADALLLVTPAQSLRDAATSLAPHLATDIPVIVCAKGIERGTYQFMTEIVAK